MGVATDPQSSFAEDTMEGWVGPERRVLPSTRDSVTHKFVVGGQEGYITAGLYEDGSVGEIFVYGMGKHGSTMDGFIQAWAITFSIALQHGASLEMLCRKLSHMRFEPEGRIGMVQGAPEINEAPSIIAYISKWLALRFGPEGLYEELEEIGRNIQHG